MYTLKVVRSTKFKQSTNQAITLPDSDVVTATPGAQYPVAAFTHQQGHLRFTLGKDENGKQITLAAKNTWFAWLDDVELVKNGKTIAVLPPIATAKGSMMIITPTGKQDQFAGDLYKLSWVKDGREMDWVHVISGQPGLKPVAREKDYSGSMRPCPAGTYQLGEVEEGHWGSAIGGLWISVYGTEPRQAVGIHLDANRAYSPGSAGCVCPITESDMRRVAAWRDAGANTLKVSYV